MSKQQYDSNYQDSEAGTREHVLIVDGEEVSPREYARVMGMQEYDWTDEEIEEAVAQNETRSFRMMR